MASSDTPDVVGDVAGVLSRVHQEWIYDSEVERALAMWDPRPLSSELVAFIRAQSPEWVAELIGGEVETGPGRWSEYDQHGVRRRIGTQARVVGPWREVDDRG